MKTRSSSRAAKQGAETPAAPINYSGGTKFQLPLINLNKARQVKNKKEIAQPEDTNEPIEETIVIPKPKRNEKKKKNNIIVKEESEKIITPGWQRELIIFSAKKNYSEDELYINEVIEYHKKLELLEHRINTGRDEEHIHPAMSLQILDKDPGEISNRERRRLENYDPVIVDNYIPKGWPIKRWDDFQSKLNRGQTDSLWKLITAPQETKMKENFWCDPSYKSFLKVNKKEATKNRTNKKITSEDDVEFHLDKSDDDFDEDFESFSESKALEHRNHRRKRCYVTNNRSLIKLPLMVNLSTQYFDTDDSDDLTDFDDY